jgi:hypothetical protein
MLPKPLEHLEKPPAPALPASFYEDERLRALALRLEQENEVQRRYLVALAQRLEQENAAAHRRLAQALSGTEGAASPLPGLAPAPLSSAAVPAASLAPTAGRLLWLVALSAGITVLGVVSHMGADSRRGTYSVISVQELQTTGVWTVLLWLGVLCSVGLAAWLEKGLRSRVLGVTVLVTALMVSGIFWSIAATVLEQHLGMARFGVLAALGGLVGLVLWMRLLTLGFRGALFGRA